MYIECFYIMGVGGCVWIVFFIVLCFKARYRRIKGIPLAYDPETFTGCRHCTKKFAKDDKIIKTEYGLFHQKCFDICYRLLCDMEAGKLTNRIN